jgi:hypothetical protein
MERLTEQEFATDALKVNGFNDSFGYNDKIFLLDNWEVGLALGYLVGIASFGNDSDTGMFCLETLSQKKYSDPKDRVAIDYFFADANELRVIWDSGSHKEMNPPKYYIDWAITKKIDIPWLDYAIKNGFYEPAELVNKPLGNKERDNLYRIIGALKDTLTTDPIGATDSIAFKSEAKLIEYLTPQYKGYDGLGKTNLEKVFALASKLLK